MDATTNERVTTMALNWTPKYSILRGEWDRAINDYAVIGPKPTHDGAVLDFISRDVRIMSDVWASFRYARVWDGSKIIEVAVEGDGTKFADAAVDATPEIKAAAAAWEANETAKREKAARIASVDKRIAYARAIEVGKDVEVVRGRKVKIGSKGRAFWYGHSKFGVRVGLELTNGERVFTAATNVEVSNPDDYLDIDALIEYAA